MTHAEGSDQAAETWFTPDDVAERLKLTRTLVLRLIESGALESVDILGERRISADALGRYLASAQKPAHALPLRPKRRSWLASFSAGLVLGAVLLTAGLRAQTATGTSEAIPYHGYLEENGDPVEGKKYFTFCLSRAAADTDCIWSESHTLDVAAGRFSALLGSINSLDTYLQQSGNLYIGVTVDSVTSGGQPSGSPVALEGKQLLGSVPFARRAAPGKGFAVDGAVSASSLSVANGATVGQSLTVTNQVSATQLNLNGRIVFQGVDRFCIFANVCPSGWTNRGRAAFASETECPFGPPGTAVSGLTGYEWCSSTLCCN